MFFGKILKCIRKKRQEKNNREYEFCPRCNANLTFQKGYNNNVPFWICKGCGEMLINPEIDTDSNVVWICDGCGAMLNIQSGFNEDCSQWKCIECGFINKINEREVYFSDAEYQSELRNPYRGLSDDDYLRLSLYEEVKTISTKDNIILVRQCETRKKYVKKILSDYNRSIYEYLRAHPVKNMPRIFEIYDSVNYLIVIEEFVEGKTVEDILENGALSERQAVNITKGICEILNILHHLPTPIIHRDIKPSNVIVSPTGEVFLLDINVAKWYEKDLVDDTRYMGTRNYAAPEQVGYGMHSSSTKTDVYAVGVMLNVMMTCKFPKEARAPERIWKIVERCINLDPENRYTDLELIEELDRIEAEIEAK